MKRSGFGYFLYIAVTVVLAHPEGRLRRLAGIAWALYLIQLYNPSKQSKYSNRTVIEVVCV